MINSSIPGLLLLPLWTSDPENTGLQKHTVLRWRPANISSQGDAWLSSMAFSIIEKIALPLHLASFECIWRISTAIANTLTSDTLKVCSIVLSRREKVFSGHPSRSGLPYEPLYGPPNWAKRPSINRRRMLGRSGALFQGWPRSHRVRLSKG